MQKYILFLYLFFIVLLFGFFSNPSIFMGNASNGVNYLFDLMNELFKVTLNNVAFFFVIWRVSGYLCCEFHIFIEGRGGLWNRFWKRCCHTCLSFLKHLRSFTLLYPIYLSVTSKILIWPSQLTLLDVTDAKLKA